MPITLTRRSSIVILALVAAGIVATEVLLTRLLSLCTYYGLAFAVLSLAMLGLSAGSLDALRAQRKGEPLGPWIGQRLCYFAAAIIGTTVVTTCLPITFNASLTSFASLVMVACAAAAPLIVGGSIVARILGESDVPVPILYAVDLAFAALGALAPLVMLGPLSAPSALLAISVVLSIAGAALTPVGRPRVKAVSLAVLALGAILINETTSSSGLVVLYPKGVRRENSEPAIYQAWTPLSHVELRPFVERSSASVLWAPSPMTPKGTATVAYAMLDGDAGTFVHAYTDLASQDIFRFDATTAAHRLRPNGTACVVGAGGGRDLLAALVYGHDRVFGVEINPGIVAMGRAAGDRSPLFKDPRVQIVVGDGRAELSKPGLSCRVLQATLVDTWAATSAGAFAHSEATLYTLEAWRIFLHRVEPDGVLTFSRWYDGTHIEETARLVSLAVASLLDRGVREPRNHIALVVSGRVATILLSPAPFSREDLATIHTLNSELRFPILLAPDRAPSPTGSLLDSLTQATTLDDLEAAGAPLGLDTSAPTDDRPFFFQLRSASAWLHPIALVKSSAVGGVLAGNDAAMLQLLITTIAVMLLGGALLGPTLIRASRNRTSSSRSSDVPLDARATVYFASLGAGFMMTEVALVQRMHVVLGHPTYALVVVLAGLLLATGVGSALSPRILRTRQSVMIAALVAAVLLAILPHVVIGPLARASLESSLGVRAAWTGACSGLVGIILGMLFPSGLRYVSREAGTPVALAINGFTSILGSTAAIIISVWANIPTTFAIAGLIYAIAGLTGPTRWKPQANAKTQQGEPAA